MSAEKQERGSNSIVLRGHTYMVVLTGAISQWETEVSAGYAGAVRPATYKQLRGSVFLSGPKGQELELEIEGESFEKGRGHAESLHSIFYANAVDQEAYADYVARKILEEFNKLQAGKIGVWEGFVQETYGRTFLNLSKFEEEHDGAHYEELVEAGILPEPRGQIRFPLGLVE